MCIRDRVGHGLFVGPLLQNLAQMQHEHHRAGGGEIASHHGHRDGGGIQHGDGPVSYTHLRNSISMDSASSQFFIVHKDSTFLDGQYAAFGYVTDGMDAVSYTHLAYISSPSPYRP